MAQIRRRTELLLTSALMSAGPQPRTLQLEIDVQYNSRRATDMMKLQRSYSNLQELETHHMDELQKDLVALGLPESLAKSRSASHIIWGTGQIRCIWVVTKDSVCYAPSWPQSDIGLLLSHTCDSPRSYLIKA